MIEARKNLLHFMCLAQLFFHQHVTYVPPSRSPRKCPSLQKKLRERKKISLPIYYVSAIKLGVIVLPLSPRGFLLFAEIEVWQHPRQGVSFRCEPELRWGAYRL
jgi:hypothetical protein